MRVELVVVDVEAKAIAVGLVMSTVTPSLWMGRSGGGGGGGLSFDLVGKERERESAGDRAGMREWEASIRTHCVRAQA